MRFETTDFVHAVPIEYEGILPDLFREGKGLSLREVLIPEAFSVLLKY